MDGPPLHDGTVLINENPSPSQSIKYNRFIRKVVLKKVCAMGMLSRPPVGSSSADTHGQPEKCCRVVKKIYICIRKIEYLSGQGEIPYRR